MCAQSGTLKIRGNRYDIGEFNNGFASVQLNNKWKLIDTDGKFFEY